VLVAAQVAELHHTRRRRAPPLVGRAHRLPQLLPCHAEAAHLRRLQVQVADHGHAEALGAGVAEARHAAQQLRGQAAAACRSPSNTARLRRVMAGLRRVTAALRFAVRAAHCARGVLRGAAARRGAGEGEGVQAPHSCRRSACSGVGGGRRVQTYAQACTLAPSELGHGARLPLRAMRALLYKPGRSARSQARTRQTRCTGSVRREQQASVQCCQLCACGYPVGEWQLVELGAHRVAKVVNEPA